MSCFSVLVNKKINGMFIGNDAWTLVFRDINGNHYRFDTANDCCNSVWFNHVNGVDSVLGSGNSFDILRGATVLAVESKDFERQDLEDEHECVDDAFVTIRTDRGYIDLEVRNSHNGYYGGSISYNQDGLADVEDLKPVTADF
jgi:hypothetical protein